jgi:hypothetical protein
MGKGIASEMLDYLKEVTECHKEHIPDRKRNDGEEKRWRKGNTIDLAGGIL